MEDQPATESAEPQPALDDRADLSLQAKGTTGPVPRLAQAGSVHYARQTAVAGGRLPPVTGKDLLKRLRQLGCTVVRTRGPTSESHAVSAPRLSVPEILT